MPGWGSGAGPQQPQQKPPKAAKQPMNPSRPPEISGEACENTILSQTTKLEQVLMVQPDNLTQYAEKKDVFTQEKYYLLPCCTCFKK